MKKVIAFICMFTLLVMPVKVYADSASVVIKVNGEVKKGSTIEILVDVKSVDKLYAASVDFVYDTTQLKVESINASEFITKHLNDIMELGGETDKNGNTATYSFTFLGDKEGIKESGTLVTIKAQVLNDEKLSINYENMKIKLVQRVGETVENYNYSFKGYDSIDDSKKTIVDNSQGNNSTNNSISKPSNDSTTVSEEYKKDGNFVVGVSIVGSIIVLGGTSCYFYKKKKNENDLINLK